jgi:hypothetical protein
LSGVFFVDVFRKAAIDRFNASVTRAMDLHLLKQDTKEEDGEHIFIKSNLKKLKILLQKIKWIEALVIM